MRTCAFVLVGLIASCAKPGPYTCAIDPDCGDGFCEVGGLCSVTDGECPSGRRYGDLAGASSGTCVDPEKTMPDEIALCGVTAARPDGTGTCAAMVCAADPSCCEISWDRQCARTAEARCDLECEEIVAAGGYQYAAAFSLSSPRAPLWSANQPAWSYLPAWGDIEGDGRPDLAIAREGSVDVTGLLILQSSGLSNGALVLTPATIAGDPITWISHVEWRDFDADGDLDLLASGQDGVWVVVTDNDTFTAHRLTAARGTAAWIATSSAPPWRIAVVYDGDPQGEAVVHTFDESFDIISMSSLGMRGGVDGMAWCQVGGTGDRDLIIGSDIYLANSMGFAAPTSASGSGYYPSCGDLDGDGDNDLVLGDYDFVRIIMNEGGLTTPAVTFPTTFTSGISLADFDNNGRLDILAASGTNERTEIPLLFIDNQVFGFESQDILPDWNTSDLDSQNLDIGRPPLR